MLYDKLLATFAVALNALLGSKYNFRSTVQVLRFADTNLGRINLYRTITSTALLHKQKNPSLQVAWIDLCTLDLVEVGAHLKSRMYLDHQFSQSLALRSESSLDSRANSVIVILSKFFFVDQALDVGVKVASLPIGSRGIPASGGVLNEFRSVHNHPARANNILASGRVCFSLKCFTRMPVCKPSSSMESFFGCYPLFPALPHEARNMKTAL
mmetsp:Transcript_12874/g.19019  ORF Transcript_12874/g.19019 Transcript_12874/m.19019 type:complete len:212 (-) Transcript_12874:491-1126(-)